MLLLSPARTPANICQHLFSSSSVTQAFAPSGRQAEAQFAPLGIHFSTMPPLASTAPPHPPHPIASSSRRHPDAWFCLVFIQSRGSVCSPTNQVPFFSCPLGGWSSRSKHNKGVFHCFCLRKASERKLGSVTSNTLNASSCKRIIIRIRTKTMAGAM